LFLAKCKPLLVQRNINGSDFFNRSWAEFKVGFNDRMGNYWLGNEMLHQLTTNGSYKLKFDLQARNGSWYYAEYSRFKVSNETSNYKIQVSGYSGDTGDALWFSDGMAFTTYDRDNDQYNDNCAVRHGGGFWYNNCVYCGVNVARAILQYFRWVGRVGTRNDAIDLPLQSTRMWLTC